MADFEDQLRTTLRRNEEIAQQRAEAEEELARLEAEMADDAERREREAQRAREERHAELVDHLKGLVEQLESSAATSVLARTGWSASGEEFVAKITSVQLRPKRSLFIELDRDDDEVLARWNSDVGRSVEMWRLHEVTPQMLTELVLQTLDESAWSGATGPPPFPGTPPSSAAPGRGRSRS